MRMRATWICLALACSFAAMAADGPSDATTAVSIPAQAASLAPAQPSHPVAPSQPAAPSSPPVQPTIPVVATDASRGVAPTPTVATAAPASVTSNIDYFCQTLAADGDHRTKYVSRVFPSASTSQSLTHAWLGYLQATYHVDRSASGSCARVAKTFEQTLPDREKQWQAMSLNVVHVDWKG
ncbi:MAG TPA: hypothetical protein VMJ74_01010 [Pseudomonadales bacterium]|nr:hypothetical protein [Pseudomonadales bacterium]